jgi:O-antigen biosynthesis protein WbqP
MLKRSFDILFSLIALIVLSLPGAIIFILIKTTSKGDVIFWSERVGKNNKIFLMPKYRTMVLNCPLIATHLLEESLDHFTSLGRILRLTSLDELPQIWSILRGDMSVVGPRPALFNQDDLIEMRTRRNVHTILPGLTGLAQINGRDDLSLEAKVDYDAEYLEKQNLLLDIVIIVKTVYIVLSKKGIRH